jgi:hypothetical protein
LQLSGQVAIDAAAGNALGSPRVPAVHKVQSPGGYRPRLPGVTLKTARTDRNGKKKVTMTMSVIGLSIDCADPVALAGFWSEVLGRPVNPGADAENAAIDATDPASGPRLAFHKVPESKTVKNRLHLDLLTDQFEDESKRLIGLGAAPLWDIDKPTARWTTFADPEGNEFDLVAAQPPAAEPGE